MQFEPVRIYQFRDTGIYLMNSTKNECQDFKAMYGYCATILGNREGAA